MSFINAEAEKALTSAAKKGDKEAFGQLVLEFRDRAIFIAYSFAHNKEAAEDLAQDAFLKAFKAMPSFEEGQPFLPWFMRILKNTCLNEIKKKANTSNSSLEEMEEETFLEMVDNRPDPRERCASEEMKRKLWLCMERLKGNFREIIIMVHFLGLSYREVAESLNIPQGTVMSRLFNARQELKQLMTA